MKKNEIEIKIELTLKEFKNLAPSGDSNLEKTFGYFKKDFSNIKDGVFPRIKYIKGEKNETILTVKVKTNENNNFFEREEIEVKIKDEKNIDNLRDMLKYLGFSKEIIFEKRRKNIKKGDAVISFDELPFGFFVEIEGKPEKIERYVQKLGLSNRPRITKSYLGLWEDYKSKHNIREENCIFK